MARKRIATAINLLSTKQIQNAADGDLSDGGGLILRVRGESASHIPRDGAARFAPA